MLWTTQLHEMRRYRAIHGTAYVPAKWEDPTGDFNNHLAKWVHQQPTLFAQRRLTLAQASLLCTAQLCILLEHQCCIQGESSLAKATTTTTWPSECTSSPRSSPSAGSRR